MGLGKASMDAFRGDLRAVLEDTFPGVLTIGADDYKGAGSGGRRFREFDAQGLEVTRVEHLVRIGKDLLADAPAIGALVTWTASGGAAVLLKVQEVPDRAHEEAHTLRLYEA